MCRWGGGSEAGIDPKVREWTWLAEEEDSRAVSRRVSVKKVLVSNCEGVAFRCAVGPAKSAVPASACNCWSCASKNLLSFVHTAAFEYSVGLVQIPDRSGDGGFYSFHRPYD